MKNKLKITAVILFIALAAVSLTSCNLKGNANLLGKPSALSSSTCIEYVPEYLQAFNAAVNDFSFRFSENVYDRYDGIDNFTVSPISVFSALATAAECANGKTRDQILAALGTDYDLLKDLYGAVYSSLQRTFATGKLSVVNSVWLDERAPYKQSAIDTLSQKYYCYSYSADFANDNENANRAVRNFVKEQTRGLIDKDFNLSTQTLFTLVTALYLKDNWLGDGSNLQYTDDEYAFYGSGGEQREKFLKGQYIAGRVIDGDGYQTFYARTDNGYKIKFILPDEGVPLDKVFNADTLSEVNSLTDYNATDDTSTKHYFTRCLFPEFNADYDDDIKPVLQSMGITSLFDAYDCNMHGLIDDSFADPVYCSSVTHATKLIVDKKGIEGAAVVVIPADSESAPPYYEKVYLDFVVNRSFGFIITDFNNVPLFSGVVNTI